MRGWYITSSGLPSVDSSAPVDDGDGASAERQSRVVDNRVDAVTVAHPTAYTPADGTAVTDESTRVPRVIEPRLLRSPCVVVGEDTAGHITTRARAARG
jgi:hypothetical protein